MKRQIRRSAFETNSSSTHTITISKKPVYEVSPSLHFEGGEYGWDVDKLNTPIERASYLFTAIASMSDRDKLVEHVREVLAKHGCQATFEEWGSGWAGNGFIDHEGRLTNLIGMLMSDEDLLMTYLFGDACVYTYNDNMDYEDMRYSKEIDNYSEDEYLIYEKGN